MKRKSSYTTVIGAALMLAIVGFTFVSYEGTIGPFVLFNVSYLLLMLLAVPRPRLYVYTFLSLFLFLGFWMRFTFHTSLGYGYQYSVGEFDGSGASWDLVLLVSSSGAIGIVVVRSLHLWLARRFSARGTELTEDTKAPGWYYRYKGWLWISTILLVVALNSLNATVAFYQTGVNPKVILPLHLNVVAAWLINIGFALWIAVLVHWETAVRRSTLKYTLIAPLAEGLISTVSILSRSVYLFHTLPYVFVVTGRRWRSALSGKAASLLVVLFVLAFLGGLVGVSGLRLYTYPGTLNLSAPKTEAASSESPFTKNQVLVITTRHVLRLFVERWNGLEGVFAVSSHEGLGYDLLVEGIREDPNKGESSLYQRISKSDEMYQELDDFTFLNLAGSMAILFYSGSLLVVAAGMAILTSVVMMIELVFAWLIRNPFLSSVSGLAMANTICQLNFPYLAGVFIVELVVTLAFIWLLQSASKTEAVPVSNRASRQGV